MKKFYMVKKIFAVILLFAFTFLICSCEKEKTIYNENDEEIFLSDYIGTWELDYDTSNAFLDEGESLTFLLGSMLRDYGASLEIKDDNTISYYAGGLQCEGTFTFNDDELICTVTSLNDEENTYEIKIKYEDHKLFMYDNELILVWEKLN